jgi:hypothetical protein
MSPNKLLSPGERNILGSFAGQLGLLSVILYFTGWVYRWAYFGFFQLEVTTLDLPLESFFMVPLQVFLGDFWTLCKTVFAVVIASFLIQLTLWAIQALKPAGTNNQNKLCSQVIQCAQKLHKSFIAQKLRQFLETIFPQPLLNEMVIVAWVLTILFWLAQSQGTVDAYRDAVNTTSLLPVVTLVTPENHLALGRKIDDLLTNPSMKGYRIIGDKGVFDRLRGRETNDTTNPTDPIVWRLLMERGGWIYLFPSLPPNAASTNRPYILVVRESGFGDQLLILSNTEAVPANRNNRGESSN